MKIKDRAKPKVSPVEPGVYMAVCIGFVDLGEQYSEKFKTHANKGMYIWELPTETIEIDGEQKPRQLSKEFTISASKKGNLRSFLESWNGKSYSDDEFADLDLFDQVGKANQIQVVLNESGEYSNVANLMPIPKGFPSPTSDTPHIKFNIDEWNDETFAALPEWIQEKIKKSTQYQMDHAPDTPLEIKSAPPSAGECPI